MFVLRANMGGQDGASVAAHFGGGVEAVAAARDSADLRMRSAEGETRARKRTA